MLAFSFLSISVASNNQTFKYSMESFFFCGLFVCFSISLSTSFYWVTWWDPLCVPLSADRFPGALVQDGEVHLGAGVLEL